MDPTFAASTASRGFTLTEMLVVIVLLGVVGMLTTNSLAGHDEARVEAAAHEVAEALRFARSQSRHTNVIHGVHLDSSAESLRIFRVDLSSLPPSMVFDVLHPLSRRAWDVDFDVHLPARGVDLTQGATFFEPCTTPGYVVFAPDGHVLCLTSPTTILDNGVFLLTRGDAGRAVALDGLTGRVSVP